MNQMFFSLIVYIRLVLVTLVTISCLIGDNVVEITRHPLLRALADNATHAVIGALSGITFVFHFYDRLSNVTGWLIIFGCFIWSSFIDLDHFIEAGSWSLERATSIMHRPFLHCSTIPLILFMIYVMTCSLNYFRASLALATVCCAFFTHHSRDAYRRGLWFCPFGHTGRLPYSIYMLLTIATPYIMFYVHILCRSNILQNIFSSKHHDGQGRFSSRYSIV